MSKVKETAADAADLLARAYVDTLAKVEGVKHQSMLHRPEQDAVAEMLADLEGEPSEDAPQLRVDLVVTAVLTAKAVAAEYGLARRLRREAPVLTIATHTADMVPLVETIVCDCATSSHQRKHIVARDGTDRVRHLPAKGNSDVVAALNKRHLIAGIAPDPKRHLPSSLSRTAEYRLSLPAIDEWSLRLVLEAMTGTGYAGEIDEDLVRATDISDLSLAIRSGMTPLQCLERLAETVRSKSDHVGDGPRLEDLHGYGAAKQWGLELAADLADYKAGRLTWDMLDHKGLLLSGAPGTGKTSFAKALAKTAGVPLVSSSVAQWNAAAHLGGTLQAIRDTFGEARRSAPCLLFIDEIDGISDRATLSGDYIEYWTQIVNLLLECLAGIEDRPGVVVVAATNFPEKIDAAIRRSGRLDREIRLEKPDTETLAKIFGHHLAGMLSEADLMPVALAARGATGADVEAWVRRAKAAARRAGREVVIEDLLEQIRSGAPVMSPEARRRVAVHEVGHAITGCVLRTGRLVGVSIHHHGGKTEFDEVIDGTTTAERLERHIAVALAGRAAERLILGDIGIGSGEGPQSDLAKATRMAQLLETNYGFGSFGNVFIGDGHINVLPRYPGLLEAVKARLDMSENRAIVILGEQREALEKLAIALDERGYLSDEDVEAVVFGAADSSVSQLIEAAQ